MGFHACAIAEPLLFLFFQGQNSHISLYFSFGTFAISKHYFDASLSIQFGGAVVTNFVACVGTIVDVK